MRDVGHGLGLLVLQFGELFRQLRLGVGHLHHGLLGGIHCVVAVLLTQRLESRFLLGNTLSVLVLLGLNGFSRLVSFLEGEAALIHRRFIVFELSIPHLLQRAEKLTHFFGVHAGLGGGFLCGSESLIRISPQLLGSIHVASGLGLVRLVT